MEFVSSAVAGLLAPDALTPEQYYAGVRANDLPIRPIKRLMLAVLEDAMRCYQTCGNSRSRARQRMFAEAEAWLLDGSADGPFAFETICQTLGIEPGCLRKGLREWRALQMSGANPRPLARRSPVTREGRISSPLRRRRRKAAQAAPGQKPAGVGVNAALAAAVNGGAHLTTVGRNGGSGHGTFVNGAGTQAMAVRPATAFI
ncbi:MAG TPA: hypothetical protein VFB33_17610 [Candidatus Binataceae bacterium]|jgi:hypothetical protein|nr:hypothetical protein [Candidatus Binataceae bacterium]